jgi:hypothetical protein
MFYTVEPIKILRTWFDHEWITKLHQDHIFNPIDLPLTYRIKLNSLYGQFAISV